MASDLSSPQTPEAVRQEFQDLIAQVRAGSEDAAWKLVELYGPHIQRAVRQRLHKAMKSKFDSVDFVQAVWASFFTCRAQATEFDDPSAFVAFLAAMARNKVVDEVRRRTATQKYDVRRECAYHDDLEVAPQSVVERQNTPSQYAVARERWDRMMRNQPEHYREIIRLKYLGESCAQIAARLGMNERSVRKALEKMFDEE